MGWARLEYRCGGRPERDGDDEAKDLAAADVDADLDLPDQDPRCRSRLCSYSLQC